MSRLRITGGAARGRVLREPVPSGVRPTGERMREAFFSMVGQDLEGVRFLDLCAGSGIMGLEAWSRGAVVTAVEQRRAVLHGIARRAEELGAELTLKVGTERRLPAGPFDLAFCDPPYRLDPEPFLSALSAVATEVWMEVDGRRSPPTEVGELKLVQERRYGDSSLWHFSRG